MNVVWHCEDVVGERMAGPGIRATELSRRLAQKHEVTLVAEGARPVAELSQALRGADVFVAAGVWVSAAALLRFRGRVVLDLVRPGAARAPGTAADSADAGGARLARGTAAPAAVSGAGAPTTSSALRARSARCGWAGSARSAALAGGAGAAIRRRRGCSRWSRSGFRRQPPVRKAHRSGKAARPPRTVALWCGGLWDWMDPRWPCALSPWRSGACRG